MAEEEAGEHATAFDSTVDSYEEDLEQGLRLTGENREHYARRRLQWTRRLVGSAPRVIDFGCAGGWTTPLIHEVLEADSVVGLDISEKLVARARQAYGSLDTSFVVYEPGMSIEPAELVYLNGVFHHVPLSERRSVADFLFRCVAPEGHVVLWENNPLNPGTRWVMSRIPFDHDAIPVWPRQARHLLQQAGFAVVVTRFCFVFPRFLSALRGIERQLSRLPLGGQYVVVGRRAS